VNRQRGRLLAAEHDVSRAGDEPEDTAQRRGLADAVAAEQPGDSALPHVEETPCRMCDSPK